MLEKYCNYNKVLFYAIVEAAVSRLAYQESNLILIVLGNYLLNYGFLGLICMHITYIVN